MGELRLSNHLDPPQGVMPHRLLTRIPAIRRQEPFRRYPNQQVADSTLRATTYFSNYPVVQ